MQKQLKFAIKMESEAWITEAAALVADGVSIGRALPGDQGKGGAGMGGWLPICDSSH